MSVNAPRKLQLYARIESALGRSRLYRLGRFLYLGARRELHNDPKHNGEYALIRWLLGRSASSIGPIVLFDVGANIGDWTAEALEVLARTGQAERSVVHAFEPAPPQRASLSARHAAAIGNGRLVIHDCAVGASAGRVRFEVTGEASGTSAISHAAVSPASVSIANMIDVDVKTIDALVSELGIECIALLKVDTEGNDFNVIQGARSLLGEGRIGVLQFEYNWRWIEFGHFLKSVFDFTSGLDYDIGVLTEAGIEVHDVWHPELDRFFETNYVLVRRDLLDRLPHERMAFSAANEPVALTIATG